MAKMQRFSFFLTAFVISASFAAAGSSSGLLGYWNFDNDVGSIAVDSSGNGADGVKYGLVNASGFAGSAADWNDDGDRIIVLNPTLFDSARNLSIAFWMKPDSAGPVNFGRVMNLVLGSSERNGMGISFAGSANVLQFVDNRWDNIGVWRYDKGSSFIGGWTHIVVVYDGYSANNDPVIYINGTKMPMVELAAPGGAWAGDNDRLVIGNRDDAAVSDRQFDGVLDEVMIYNRSLSDAEADAIFHGQGISQEQGNKAPAVNAGADQTVGFPAAANLEGTVADDGLPPNGSLMTKWSKVSGPGTVAFQDETTVDTVANFSVNGTYVLRLDANDSELAAGDDIIITVIMPDTAAPSVPQNVAATAVKSDGMNLSWSASADNVGVAGYNVFRDGVLIGTSPVTDYIDAGLQPSTAYAYEVSAFDGAGFESARSSQAQAITGSSPILTAIGVSPNAVTVAIGDTRQFSAAGADQYDDFIAANYSWSVSGGGIISGNGLFTAEAAGGPFIVTAQSGTVHNGSFITVINASLPDEGLLSYLRFDDGSGRDSSPNGLDGIAYGLVNVSGHSGSALEWNDDGDRLSIIDNGAFDNLTKLTVAFWMKPDSAGPVNAGRIWRTLSGPAGESRVISFDWRAPDTAVLFDGRWGTGGVWKINGSFIGKWTHVAVVYDASLPLNDPVIYLNGIPAQLTETSAPSGGFSFDVDRFIIGNRYDAAGSDRQFDGVIDEFRIYNRTLSEGEVAVLAGIASQTGANNSTNRTSIADYLDDRKAAMTLVFDTELYLAKIHSKSGYLPINAQAEANNDKTGVMTILQDTATYGIPVTFAMTGHWPLFEDYGEHNGIDTVHPWAGTSNGWADDHWLSNSWYSDEIEGGGNYQTYPYIYGGNINEYILNASLMHEIGTHTFGHMQLDLINESALSAELSEAVSAWKPFAIKPTSLAPPWNANPQLSKYDEIISNGVFTYNKAGPYAQPAEIAGDLWSVPRSLENFANNDLTAEINYIIENGLVMADYSHPVDVGGGNGRMNLQNNLAYMKSKVDSGELWATTQSEIARYWEAKSDAIIETYVINGTSKQVNVTLPGRSEERFGIPGLTLKTPVSNSSGIYKISVSYPSGVILNTNSSLVRNENGVLVYTVYVNPQGTTTITIEEVSSAFTSGSDTNFPYLQVSSASHSVNASGAITITSAINSTDELYNVGVIYWTANSTKHAVSMSPAMQLGIWAADIGPFSSGDVVTYYIIAADNSGRRTLSPHRTFVVYS